MSVQQKNGRRRGGRGRKLHHPLNNGRKEDFDEFDHMSYSNIKKVSFNEIFQLIKM